jgi:hypothetical protein
MVIGTLHTLRTANMYMDSRLSLSPMKLKVCAEPMSAVDDDIPPTADPSGKWVQLNPPPPEERDQKQTDAVARALQFGCEGEVGEERGGGESHVLEGMAQEHRGG